MCIICFDGNENKWNAMKMIYGDKNCSSRRGQICSQLPGRLKASRFQKFSRGETTGPPSPRGFAPLVLAGSDFASTSAEARGLGFHVPLPTNIYIYLFWIKMKIMYVLIFCFKYARNRSISSWKLKKFLVWEGGHPLPLHLCWIRRFGRMGVLWSSIFVILERNGVHSSLPLISTESVHVYGTR